MFKQRQLQGECYLFVCICLSLLLVLRQHKSFRCLDQRPKETDVAKNKAVASPTVGPRLLHRYILVIQGNHYERTE